MGAKIDAEPANNNEVPASGPKLLCDIHESASRLSMSVGSVRKLIRQRRIQRLTDFRKILISASELERFASIH